MQSTSNVSEPSMSFGECPKINLAGSNLIGTATDCLHFSNVFTLSGYETVNDKILLEMNEKVRAAQKQREDRARRAAEPSVQSPGLSITSRSLPVPPLTSSKFSIPRSASQRQVQHPHPHPHPHPHQHQQHQQQHSYQSQQQHPPVNAHKKTMSTSASVQARLQDLARITRSPPETRYSTAHNKEFAQSASLASSPLSKRQADGEESPSKRRRAPGGAAIGIMNSPSKSLETLSLKSNANRLEGVSIARQRDRQRRDLQTSPRRRLPVPNEKPANISLSTPAPPLMPGSFPRPQQQPQQHQQVQSPHQRPLPTRQDPGKRNFSSPLPRRLDSSNTLAIPRSQSTKVVPRSVSLQSVSDTQASRTVSTSTDRVPSYARPTQAALRRSQSNQHVAMDKARRQ